jgi:hypothetical protein
MTTTNLNTSQTGSSNTVLDTLNTQLVEMDKLLNDPNFDHGRVLEQALKVLMLMSRLLGKTEKEYVLNNETELFAQVKEMKGTYNTWSVLAVTIASGSLTIAGGFVGMGAAIPGTSLGQSIGSSAPNALGWLSNADWAKKLGGIGQGIGSVGQGTGSFSSLLNNSNEAKRAFCHVVIEEVKRKRSDRDDASRQMRDQANAASSNCRQALQAVHNAASQILTSR